MWASELSHEAQTLANLRDKINTGCNIENILNSFFTYNYWVSADSVFSVRGWFFLAGGGSSNTLFTFIHCCSSDQWMKEFDQVFSYIHPFVAVFVNYSQNKPKSKPHCGMWNVQHWLKSFKNSDQNSITYRRFGRCISFKYPLQQL